MSKERLEEIKQRLVLLHNAADVDDETKNYIFEDLKVEWLIERVQGLEGDKKALGDLIEETAKTAWNIEQQNKRYREAIEYIKLELKDFRKDAITIKKLSRDRIVQNEAFSLSCDIRDCLKALEGEG